MLTALSQASRGTRFGRTSRSRYGIVRFSGRLGLSSRLYRVILRYDMMRSESVSYTSRSSSPKHSGQYYVHLCISTCSWCLALQQLRCVVPLGANW